MTENTLLAGALGGFAATMPMTLAMKLMHIALPYEEQYPLPPSEITAVVEQASVGKQVAPQTHTVLTTLAHFGYGAAAGALYAPLAQQFKLPPIMGGIGFGLTVWTVSYLGLLPGLGILKPATQHPARRNTLMILAHVIWGAALGATVSSLTNPSPMSEVTWRGTDSLGHQQSQRETVPPKFE